MYSTLLSTGDDDLDTGGYDTDELTQATLNEPCRTLEHARRGEGC